MKVVEFLRSNSPYNAGDVAGFEDHVADGLVRGGYAKYHSQRSEINERKPLKPEDSQEKELKDQEDKQLKPETSKRKYVTK